MSWKRYQNELIVLFALMFLLIGYGYKQNQCSSERDVMVQSRVALEEVKEVIALKKIWSDKKITQKVDKLKTLIPKNKMTWSRKGKKVTASYKGLSDKELNTLVTKILNVPIEIKKMRINRVASSYDMEFKCQW
ncbi:MAG: hypothetical protein U9O64_01930 [Campylobacterota bacterium]|nr:hypothetical protein [Campylobacterota bacterium]